jgi:hypothetical protein
VTFPVPPDKDQARRSWSSTVWAWASWLRRSPHGLVLAEWLGNPPKYQAIMGADGFRSFMLELLRDAHYEDCAAAGFSFDAGDTRSGCLGSWIQVETSPGGAHRAVFWCEADWLGSRLWVDGVPVAYAEGGDAAFHAPGGGGHWVDDRFLAARVAGPADHPLQNLYAAEPRVLSLFIYDAQRCRYHVIAPGSHEEWANPCIELHGDTLYVYANLTIRGCDAGPVRKIPVHEFDG